MLLLVENTSVRQSQKILAAEVKEESKIKISFCADEILQNKLEKLRGLLAHKNFSGDTAKLIEILADMVLEKLDKKFGSVELLNSKAKSDLDTLLAKELKPVTVFECHTADCRPKAENPNSKTNDRKKTQALNGARHVGEGTGTAKQGHRQMQKQRYISAEMRRIVWSASQGKCQYKDARSGTICGSKHALQFDHVSPISRGGMTTPQNLQLLCAAHNQFKSDRIS
jgi:5-methylcytosine-specific restriction endonuclease McrA